MKNSYCNPEQCLKCSDRNASGALCFCHITLLLQVPHWLLFYFQGQFKVLAVSCKAHRACSLDICKTAFFRLAKWTENHPKGGRSGYPIWVLLSFGVASVLPLSKTNPHSSGLPVTFWRSISEGFWRQFDVSATHYL